MQSFKLEYRQAGLSNNIYIYNICIITFRLKKNVMTIFVCKTIDFILNGGQ